MTTPSHTIYICINDITIKDNNTHNRIPIDEHPYYLSIVTQNVNHIYEKYVKQNEFQRNKKTAKWSHFMSIYDKIKKIGIDRSKSPIIVKRSDNNKYSCIHGRHRMCMLAHIHGFDALVKIKEDKIIKVKVI